MSYQELVLSERSLVSSVSRLKTPVLTGIPASLQYHNPRREALLPAVLIALKAVQGLGMKVYHNLPREKRKRVVYLCNHPQGNLDGILVSLVLLHVHQLLPFVPASERLLQDPWLGSLNKYLAYTGAFFIKSSFQELSYREEVSLLLQKIVNSEWPLLFFLGGNVDRAGRLLYPRRGLLKALSSLEEDLLFCPVNISYSNNLYDGGLRQSRFGFSEVLINLRRINACYLTFGDLLPLQDYKELARGVARSLTEHQVFFTLDLVCALLKSDHLSGQSTEVQSLQRRLEGLEVLVRNRHHYVQNSLQETLKQIQGALRPLELTTVSRSEPFPSSEERIDPVNSYSLEKRVVFTLTNPDLITYYSNRVLPFFARLIPLPELIQEQLFVSYQEFPLEKWILTTAKTLLSPLVALTEQALANITKGSTRKDLSTALNEVPDGDCVFGESLLNLLTEKGLVREEAGRLLTC